MILRCRLKMLIPLIFRAWQTLLRSLRLVILSFNPSHCEWWQLMSLSFATNNDVVCSVVVTLHTCVGNYVPQHTVVLSALWSCKCLLIHTCELSCIQLYVSVHRAPLLSLTAVHRNQKQIWVKGEFEHFRHAHCEQACPRGRAQTGGPMTPQVRTASIILANLHASTKCVCDSGKPLWKCWFAAVLTDLFHSILEETETSCKQRESDSEDEQPKHKIVCSPPPTSQRVPIFPGLSPAALIVSSQSSIFL